jgi:mRNA interferase MazF
MPGRHVVTRGEVWWADLAPRTGSEQHGRRPVIIMSSDAFNAVTTWRSVMVVPLTTSERQLRVGPTAVAIPAGTAQLPAASVALCHQITTLDRKKLVEAIGVLPTDLLRDVERSVVAALDLGAVAP